jgi:hypothetical protein
VYSTISAWASSGDLPKLVMQIVVAPASLASFVAVTVSRVLPEWEMVMTATSGSVSEALIAWTCESTTTLASTPVRSRRLRLRRLALAAE